MKLLKLTGALLLGTLTLSSCKKEGCTDENATNYDSKAKKDDGSCIYDTDTLATTEPKLKFIIKLDGSQERLDNLGNPSTVPDTHATQTPVMNTISAHYIELTESEFVLPGSGTTCFEGSETSAGGENAVHFDEAIIKGNNELFYELPLKNVAPGSYPYIRVSVTYQNYDIEFYYQDTITNNDNMYTGTIASFVGFNTYITSYQVNNETVTVNNNKSQGYWAFETNYEILGNSYTNLIEGQAPVGATTVPNPISSTSPIPVGSCLVTGVFDTPLEITGNETEDITVVLSFSINNSFEWVDLDDDDRYDPVDGEHVIDMGLRGLLPSIQ